MLDFIEDYSFPLFLVTAIICIVAGAGWWIHSEHSRFMDECIQYRKQYECTAMWRAGDDNVVFVGR